MLIIQEIHTKTSYKSQAKPMLYIYIYNHVLYYIPPILVLLNLCRSRADILSISSSKLPVEVTDTSSFSTFFLDVRLDVVFLADAVAGTVGAVVAVMPFLASLLIEVMPAVAGAR